VRVARQPDHVLHRPAPAERSPAQAQRVGHEEAVRVGLVSAAPEAVVHRRARGSGGDGTAAEYAGRRARRQRRRFGVDDGRGRKRWQWWQRRRGRRTQRQARADLHLRGGHRRHGSARQPARRPRLHRRLHHVVQQGGELPDAERVREQPDRRDAGHHGPEGPQVVTGQTGGRGDAQGRQVAAGRRTQQQDDHCHRRGVRVTLPLVIIFYIHIISYYYYYYFFYYYYC